MHKLSWVHEVVKADGELDKLEARSMTPDEIQGALKRYVAAKDDNFLDLDRDEFLESLKGHRIKSTSAQLVYASRLFDSHLEAKFKQLYPTVAADPQKTL